MSPDTTGKLRVTTTHSRGPRKAMLHLRRGGTGALGHLGLGRHDEGVGGACHEGHQTEGGESSVHLAERGD